MSEAEEAKPLKAKRATFNIPEDLMEKYRNAAWWERSPVNALITQALEAHMAELEKRNNGPYLLRRGTIAKGRPVK